MPVVEGALERSVELAAAMDSRGYGRTTGRSPGSRRTTGALVLGGVLGVCVGAYGLLDATASAWLGVPMLLAGTALAAGGVWAGGRRTGRSRYRPDPWALPEWLVAGSGVLAALAMSVHASVAPAQLVLASITEVPPVPLLACLGVLLALLPAVAAPPLPAPAPGAGRTAVGVAA
jgi:energy-coupling factor transport system permease protein